MQPFIIKNALSEQTLDFISNLEKNWSKGGFVSDKPEEIYHKQRHSHNVSISSGRRCWTMPLNDNPEISKEIEEIITKYPSHINLTPGTIDCHLLEYREEDVGFLTEHQDVYYLESDVRKLSMTIQLNDEFKGGEFCIMGETIPLEKNDAVIFPSFLPHEVRPVSEGKRNVVIGWMFGPHWQ